MRFEERVALAFSTLFHPLIIPTLGLFILFQLNTYVTLATTPAARRFILLIVFINTAVVPVLSFFIMKRTGYIKDLTLSNKNERILPLIVTAAMFFITFYMLRQISLPSLIYFFMISASLLIIITLMITFFWKISIHMVSLGGFTGFLIISSLVLRTDLNWLIILAVLVSGFTASARLILKSHQSAQVYVGYMVGVAIMMLMYFYYQV